MASASKDALQLSEQRLQLALAVAKLGSWQLTIPERTLTASAQCKANHGLPPDASLTLEGITDATDRRHRDPFLRTVERTIDTGGSFELEMPNRWPDGTDHWLVLFGGMADASCMVGLSQDATERHRILEAVMQADRRKDDFLAVLGHELRNPLSSILAGVRLLQLKGPPDPLLMRTREAITRQTLQLKRLVDDLLDTGRITAGKLRLETRVVELGSILTQAIESCTPLIEKHAHRLEVSRPEKPIFLEGDAARLVQILCNLVTNAAKYMHDGGCIHLSASLTDDGAVIIVRDEGFGIPAQMLGRIFERFVQLETSHQRAEGGLGIGLSLVKSLVEMHGGSVEARSRGVGQGSEFIVRLPVLGAADSAPQRTTSPVVGRTEQMKGA
jgi:signal transduction histidine kinase